MQLKQKSETSTSRRKFEVYTPQKHERHNDQRKEIGTHVLFVTYLPLQYRTPLDAKKTIDKKGRQRFAGKTIKSVVILLEVSVEYTHS